MITQEARRQSAEMVCYTRVEETLECAELGRYVTQSIVVHDGQGEEVARLSDVDPDVGWVDSLIKRLNEHQAAPEHLCDIVCDSLGR